jgi:tetratricopeptide (TPR) repeat protein
VPIPAIGEYRPVSPGTGATTTTEAVQYCSQSMEPEASWVQRVETAAAELAGVVNTGSWERLDHTIGALQAVLKAADAQHVGALPYSALAAALYERARTTHSAADLHACVAATQQAVLRTSFDDPARPNRLSNLGLALTAAFEGTGEARYLDEAVDASRAAVATAPNGDMVFHLSQLGVALQLRGTHRHAMADMDEAVQVGRRAVDNAKDDDPDLPGYLCNLSNSLQVRAEQKADRTDLADLDAAVTTARKAAERQAANLPGRDLALSTLGAALLTRYQRTGQPDDLDAAVDTLEDAILAVGADDPATPGYQSRLAAARLWRFDLRNGEPDLNAAVDAARRAASGAVGPIDQARYQLQLSAVLLTACWRAGPVGDIDEVIQSAHMGVESAPADHPDRAALLVNLAAAYGERYDLQQRPSDLAAAIDVGRKALNAMPNDARDRAQASANLSRVLRLRGTLTDSREDVDAAVAHAEKAVRLTELGQPTLARRLANLGDR